eukprot:4721023-Amphidinium_carterae.3
MATLGDDSLIAGFEEEVSEEEMASPQLLSALVVLRNGHSDFHLSSCVCVCCVYMLFAATLRGKGASLGKHLHEGTFVLELWPALGPVVSAAKTSLRDCGGKTFAIAMHVG